MCMFFLSLYIWKVYIKYLTSTPYFLLTKQTIPVVSAYIEYTYGWLLRNYWVGSTSVLRFVIYPPVGTIKLSRPYARC
jgi:hypothetical protein